MKKLKPSIRVEYTLLDFEENAILNTELFFCRK